MTPPPEVRPNLYFNFLLFVALASFILSMPKLTIAWIAIIRTNFAALKLHPATQEFLYCASFNGESALEEADLLIPTHV